MWKDIIDYEGLCQINEFGEIKSLERIRKGPCNSICINKEQLLKSYVANTGYFKTGVMKNRKHKNLYNHIEVAKAFIPNPLGLPQVNHKDGNKLNNFVDNLEWVTNKVNVQHAYNNNLIKPKRKIVHLTEEQIKEIISLKGVLGETKIARMFNVSHSYVNCIHNKKYKKWLHLY